MNSPQIPNNLLPGFRPLPLPSLELAAPDGCAHTFPDRPSFVLRTLAVHR